MASIILGILAYFHSLELRLSFIPPNLCGFGQIGGSHLRLLRIREAEIDHGFYPLPGLFLRRN